MSDSLSRPTSRPQEVCHHPICAAKPGARLKRVTSIMEYFISVAEAPFVDVATVARCRQAFRHFLANSHGANRDPYCTSATSASIASNNTSTQRRGMRRVMKTIRLLRSSDGQRSSQTGA